MSVTAEAGEKLLLITSDTELGGPSPSAASPPPVPVAALPSSRLLSGPRSSLLLEARPGSLSRPGLGSLGAHVVAGSAPPPSPPFLLGGAASSVLHRAAPRPARAARAPRPEGARTDTRAHENPRAPGHTRAPTRARGHARPRTPPPRPRRALRDR